MSRIVVWDNDLKTRLIDMGRDGMRWLDIGKALGVRPNTAQSAWMRHATEDDVRTRIDGRLSVHRGVLPAPDEEPFAGLVFVDAASVGKPLGRVAPEVDPRFSLTASSLD